MFELYELLVRIKNVIKFYLERFILGGAKNQLLTIAVFIIIISFASGYIHYVLYPETGLVDAVWWAFLRLTDPGYLGDDTGLARRVISTIVTILGYVLFLGSLVAIMTQWLNGIIKNLELGLTKISQRGHILIVGWNNRTPIIIREILLSQDRVGLFLRMIGKSRVRIVVLSETVSPHIVHELRDELKSLWNRRIVTFRSGVPLKIEHLDRVDFLNASVIIIPGSETRGSGMTGRDTTIVKTLLTISHYAEERGARCPDCVTEIADPDKIPVARSSYRGDLNIISAALITSRIMAQVVRQKGLSRVLSELLKNEDNEIYLRPAERFAGMTFMSVRKAFSNAVLIGLIENRDGKSVPFLNPDGNTVIEGDDELVVLAEDYGSSGPDREPLPVDYTLFRASEKQALNITRRVLIVGWNSRVPSLIREMQGYKNDSYDIDIFSSVTAAERERYPGMKHPGESGVRVSHIEGDSTRASDIRSLVMAEYDTVVFLASDRTATGEESDARTIMAFMFISDVIRNRAPALHVIVELNDPDNEVLFSDRHCEAIISPHILSYALSQVALRKKLRVIYDRLFSSVGADIIFRSALDRGVNGQMLSFGEIEDRVYVSGEIVMGLRTLEIDGTERRYVLNPSKETMWELAAGDQLIVLSK